MQQTEPDESRGAVVSRRGQKCAGISRMSSALLISQSADDGRQKRKSFPALDLKALPYFKSHGSRG